MTQGTNGDITPEKIIELAHKIADPYRYTCKLVSILLIISMLANVYLYTRGSSVTLEADENIESDITQTNN